MANPWEQYQTETPSAPPAETGPWSQFQGAPVEEVKLSPYQAFLKGLSEPVLPKGRTAIPGAMLAGGVGETLKNIGAVGGLVSPEFEKFQTDIGGALIKGADTASPVATGAGQVASYIIPANIAEAGVNLARKGASYIPSLGTSKILSAPSTTLGKAAEQGIVGGATGFALTPGEAGTRVGETAINALMGGGMPVLGKGVEMVGKKIAPLLREAPTQEQLVEKAKNLFGIAKQSGVEINPGYFSSNMKKINGELETLGYDPELYPQIKTVLSRLEDSSVAKDFNKVSALRTMIGNLQKSDNPAERNIATTLKHEFDNYLANIPENQIKAGSKEGLAAWKEARDTYSRLSKAEIFTDMLEKSDITKNKLTQSGLENALFQEIKKLATNEKQLRLFNPAEQEAIKEAARGGNIQNALRFMGKFAPTSSVSSILPLLTTAASPTVGLVGSAAAMGAKAGATAIRKTQLENLADLMRLGGQKGEVVSRLNLTPTQQNLGKMLMLQRTTQGEQ